jgi:hypothetical protein
MSNERIYTVFVRNWYKADGKTPDPRARRTVLYRNCTRDEAYTHCQHYNATHTRPANVHAKQNLPLISK